MSAHHSHFTESCCEAFRFLLERFGFTEPECKTIGRETYVQFERGNQAVSIAYEPGCNPIVELFYSCVEADEFHTPWAAKDGTPRARRIPSLHVDELFDENDPEVVRRYLRASAEALEEEEREWLAT